MTNDIFSAGADPFAEKQPAGNVGKAGERARYLEHTTSCAFDQVTRLDARGN